MQLPHRTRAGAKKRLRAISSAERRRREELLIPLEVSQLEKRRVLSGFTFNIAPVLTASGGSLTPIPANISSASNSGNLVSSLVTATSDTGKLGIAITATNSGGSSGTWQYSTDGTTWVNIGTVSSTSALLLDGADYVRFVPGTPFTGSASITFRAWDESDGSNLSYVSVTSNGGTTAFSSTTTSSSISIYSTLTISGTGTTSILDDQTTSPFNNGTVDAMIGDSSTSDLLTITITQQLTGGATDSTLADGSLSGGGFTNNSDGTYTLSGVTAAAATADLQALIFTPSRGTPTVAVKTTFQIQVSDSFGAANSQTDSGTVVTVTGNTTPTLSAVPPFAPIPENSTSATVNGTQISTLIAGLTNNANDGIAITGVDDSNGQWEWSSTNVPGSWTDLSGESASSALLLSPTDYLRFVPNAGFVGTANIEFVAWDMSVGSLHSTFDTTAYPGSGGFSSPSVTDTINVEPVISIGGTGTSYSLTSDTPAPFSLATISDSDSSDTVTITITQQFSSGTTDSLFADGTLSSPDATFTSSSSGVYTLANIPIASAQADLEAMTFTPAAGAPGTSLTTKFGIVVSDGFGSDNSASDDGTTLVVASPPLLTGVTNFADIPAETTSASQEVSTLIDANPATSGAAVVAIDDSNGTWQYSPDGTNWSAIPTTVSASSAFLLASNDEVRFVSDTGVANTATLTLLAWDGADGTAGSTFDTTAPSTAGDFSTNAEAVAITVFPVLSIGGTGTVNSSYGQTPSPFAGVSLSDTDTSESVTLTITQLNTGGVDTTLADGSLSGAGLTTNSGPDAGTYTLTAASVADAQADLQLLAFSPTAGTAGASVTTSFQIQISDSSAPANTFTTTTANDQILVVKSPPVLNGANNLPAEDANTVAGTEVSALIYNPSQVTDPSDTALGIAVVGLTDNTPADGQWQYSTAADPTDWLALPTSPSATSAFLLANTDNVRYVPATSFVGTPSMTFLAWDGSAGTAASVDTTYDTTTPASLGAFSAASATSSITVAPVLSISGTGTVDSSLGQTITPFETVLLGDTSSSDTVTITITQIVAGATDTTLADGSLSSSGPTLAESNGVYTLSGISASDAQADLQALTFTPAAGTPGASLTTSFQIEVSDRFDPTNTVVTSASGTPANEVLVVKSPPVLSGANNLPAEDANTVAGNQVSALIYNPSQVTDPSDAALGIAVVGLTDNTPADGQWQYSTAADPTDWIALPTSPSATSAFLLANTDYVRYVPATSFVGTPSLTFLAWDGSAGTAASVDATYDTTTLATLGAFSAASATSSITVAPVLSISGTGTVDSSLGQTITPFETVLLGDTDSSDTVTITITQIIAGATDTTLANGSLSSSGPTLAESNGVYTLSGISAADAQADLQALTFTPAAGTPGASLTTSFQIEVRDRFDPTNTIITSASGPPANEVLVVKSPPILNGANQMSPEDATTVTGTQISALIYNPSQVTDPSDAALGIAVVGLTDNTPADGQWEWSTTGLPGSWSDLSASGATTAFLLANSDYVQYVPKTAFVGTPTLTFLAWDGSAGTAASVDATYDTTTLATLGAFSAASATSSITVAPVLSISGTGTVDSSLGQTITPFETVLLGDSSSSDTVTITITQIIAGATDTTLADGSLSSSGPTLAESNGVYTLSGISAADAQADLQALTFTPAAGTPGASLTTSFQIEVSDGFDPTNTVVTSASGPPANEVLVVKSPPVLNGANQMSPEDATTVTGTQISALIYNPSQVTDPSDPALGIAVIGLTDNTAADGQWEWSTTGLPGSWSNLSASGATTAFLLANSDYVQYVPKTAFVGTPTLTFLAWDGSAGTAASVDTAYDATTPATLGAFSAASATTSIAVRPVLSISGTGATSINDDQQTTPFDNGSVLAMVGDTNTGETVTVTIVQEIDGAGGSVTLDSTLADGVLSGTGLTTNTGDGPNGAGTYTLTGTAAAVTAELQALVFTPNAETVGQTIGTTFEIVLGDGPGLATTKTDSNTQVETLSIASPTLTGTNNLPPLPENVASASDPGIEVSDLPTAGSSSNIGIAVSSVEDTISGMSGPVTIGAWEYSTDGAATNPTWNVISGVSSSSVLLLAPTDYIRFLPAAGYVGPSTISFQAWNQFSGAADTLSDATVALLQRGLSTNTVTASVEVAPVLTIGGTHASASLDDQTSFPFSGATISDSDPTDPVTITLTQIDVATMTTDSSLANGTLTSSDGFSGFSYNAGTGAYTLTADNAADAQAELRLLVFAPTLHEIAPGQTVTTEFKLQLADSGFGTSNTRIDTASVLTVTADATPQLNGANNLTPIPENDSSANDAGVTVASLISDGKATDSDGDSLGIAITGVETSFNANTIGEWDYSTDGGTSWTAITAVSSTSALLLAPTDLVRFLPAANYFGTATIQFQAWDQTVGSATQTIDPTALPGAGAFSTATAAASIQVVAPATITATTPSQSTTDESTINLFAAAFGSQPGVADPNTPVQTYTITVTQQLAGGATDTTLANGSLAGGGFVNNGNGTYTLSGVSATAATADLESLVFTPTAHEIVPGDSIATDFTITVNDGVNVPVSTSAALGNEVIVTVTADIDAPTFDSVQASPINFPVLASNGTVVGSDPASDVDHLSTIVYSITGGNASGIYAINSATGQITVANNASLSYSSSLTQLQVTAINTGDHGVASKAVTSAFSIALWEITASATPIAADSSTTLTLTLLSAAPSAVSPLSPAQFTIAPMTVDWSDGTTSTTSLSLAQPTVSLVHFYFANPNKANPSAAIPINVDFSAVGEQFSVQTLATVDGTGIGFVVIPNNATAFVELAPPPTLDTAPPTGAFDTPVTESLDTGVAQGQTLVGNDRRIVLRIISALDTEGSDIPLPDKTLNDLPGLFRKLPDGHYRVYLSEDGHERLVIDVVVRQGRPVDSSEDLHGTGDRPPTSQTESHDSKRFVDADPRDFKTQIVAMFEERFDGARHVAASSDRIAAASSVPPHSMRIVVSLSSAAKTNSPIPWANSFQDAGLAATASDGSAHSASFEKWGITLLSTAAGSAALSTVDVRRRRIDQLMSILSKRSLSKGARLARKFKRPDRVE